MLRLALLLVCFLGVVSPALATLAGTEHRVARQRLLEESLKPLVVNAPTQEYRITEKTQVLLNGQPCQYHEVPDDAVILRMEIASSINKEVLIVHFRSANGPVKKNPRQVDNWRTPGQKPIP